MDDNLKFLIQKYNRLVKEAKGMQILMQERSQLYGVAIQLMKMLGKEEIVIDFNEEDEHKMLLFTPQDGKLKLSLLPMKPYTEEDYKSVGTGEDELHS
jgi:hypothetical protein